MELRSRTVVDTRAHLQRRSTASQTVHHHHWNLHHRPISLPLNRVINSDRHSLTQPRSPPPGAPRLATGQRCPSASCFCGRSTWPINRLPRGNYYALSATETQRSSVYTAGMDCGVCVCVCVCVSNLSIGISKQDCAFVMEPHTHTHTDSLSVCLSVCLSVSLSLSLSLSLSRTHTTV